MTGRRSHGRLSALNGVVHQGTDTAVTLLEAIDLFTQEYVIPITTDRQTADRDKVIVGLFYRSLGFVKSAIALTSVVHRCFRHQLLLPRPYLVLTKPLRLDIQCQRGASVKIGWKYLDD